MLVGVMYAPFPQIFCALSSRDDFEFEINVYKSSQETFIAFPSNTFDLIHKICDFKTCLSTFTCIVHNPT